MITDFMTDLEIMYTKINSWGLENSWWFRDCLNVYHKLLGNDDVYAAASMWIGEMDLNQIDYDGGISPAVMI